VLVEKHIASFLQAYSVLSTSPTTTASTALPYRSFSSTLVALASNSLLLAPEWDLEILLLPNQLLPPISF
jgi:hypothetical protein